MSDKSYEVHACLGIGERSGFSFDPWELGESLKHESYSTHSQYLGKSGTHPQMDDWTGVRSAAKAGRSY